MVDVSYREMAMDAGARGEDEIRQMAQRAQDEHEHSEASRAQDESEYDEAMALAQADKERDMATPEPPTDNASERARRVLDNYSPSYGGVPAIEEVLLHQALADLLAERNEAMLNSPGVVDLLMRVGRLTTENEAQARLLNNTAATERIAIVYDGKAWFVRRIAIIEHDLEHDHMVYRCNEPLVNDAFTVGEALAALAAP